MSACRSYKKSNYINLSVALISIQLGQISLPNEAALAVDQYSNCLLNLNEPANIEHNLKCKWLNMIQFAIELWDNERNGPNDRVMSVMRKQNKNGRNLKLILDDLNNTRIHYGLAVASLHLQPSVRCQSLIPDELGNPVSHFTLMSFSDNVMRSQFLIRVGRSAPKWAVVIENMIRAL